MPVALHQLTYRQLVGAANIEGSSLFHLMSGNLSYQVEHHLYPDMPSTRYKEVAPKIKDICERYQLPYNTGPFIKQWRSVQRTIIQRGSTIPESRSRGAPGIGTRAQRWWRRGSGSASRLTAT